MLNNPDQIQDILAKDQKYLDSVAKAEEEMKKLVPLSKKIKSEFESMKDKRYMRLYKLQIYDAKKDSISFDLKPKEITEENEENENQS